MATALLRLLKARGLGGEGGWRRHVVASLGEPICFFPQEAKLEVGGREGKEWASGI